MRALRNLDRYVQDLSEEPALLITALAVEAAGDWPNTRFTGLDICPLLLSLDWLSPTVSSRISFMQYDILQPGGLPFSSGSFDLVRLSNVAFGIPEEAWQNVLDELARLLTKDGQLVVVDCNISNALDTESKQWKEEKQVDIRSDGGDEPGTKAEEKAKVQLTQTEKIGKASECLSLAQRISFC